VRSDSAPAFDPALYSALHWRNIGPYRGGRSVAATGVPGIPERFYFGAVGGGVWRSDNAGRSWTAIFDAQPVASIGAIAVAPSDPNVVYVGSGEADMRSDILQGNGMYKSVDAGQTWKRIGLEGTRAIGRIAVDPHDPERLYVAALGHPYAANEERGVFRSTDGGANWKKVLFTNADTGAISVVLDPNDSKTLFAAMWQTRRPPWNIYPPSYGGGSGLYKSTDGGDTWQHITNGLPSNGLGRIGVAVAPGDSKRVYAIVDAKDGGLYRSDDGGASFSLIGADKRIWGRGWYFCEVAVDPHDRDTAYVSNTSVYRSRDAGKSFTAIKGAPGGDDYHVLWIDPASSNRMILASDQGTVVSVDGARTWSSWYNQSTAQIYRVATDSRFPFWVYGAQQDSGAIAVPSRSSGRGISMHDWHPIEAGGESDSVAPDPLHPGILFGSRVVRQDLKTRTVRDVSPILARPGEWRATWTLPLIFSPLDPHVLYASRQNIFRTADGGSHWTTISPDLTRTNPGVPPNLDAATIADAPPYARRGVVYTIAPSPVRAHLIWAGTDDGNIALTRDEGKTWHDVTPPTLSAWSKVGIIEASHFDANTAYAAIDRHRLDDLHAHIYRTRDAGRSWTDVASDIPDGSFVNAVREDPVRRGLLFAGTETGVFVSFDDGARWQSLQADLPNNSVRDLTIRNDSLVIATHGRGFWILDDVGPLRQINARVAAAPQWLYAPARAYRIQPSSDEGTPLPPEEAAGENPPDGAVIAYTLAAPAHTVVLTVTDAQGAIVRRYASDDRVAPVDPSTLDIPAFWVTPAAVPATGRGMHRFVWDLRDAAQAAGGRRRGGGGPWAPPGTYRVQLTVDGQSMQQPLSIALDPRVHTSPADLQAQFALAREIEALRARLATAASTATKGTADSLRAIGAQLAQIEAGVESAPTAPTPEERRAFAAARAAAGAALR
jgi:photosystem II stability/assembly factor-like uncharacterized protein